MARKNALNWERSIMENEKWCLITRWILDGKGKGEGVEGKFTMTVFVVQCSANIVEIKRRTDEWMVRGDGDGKSNGWIKQTNGRYKVKWTGTEWIRERERGAEQIREKMGGKELIRGWIVNFFIKRKKKWNCSKATIKKIMLTCSTSILIVYCIWAWFIIVYLSGFDM